jgi:hypothetical protein
MNYSSNFRFVVKMYLGKDRVVLQVREKIKVIEEIPIIGVDVSPHIVEIEEWRDVPYFNIRGNETFLTITRGF